LNQLVLAVAKIQEEKVAEKAVVKQENSSGTAMFALVALVVAAVVGGYFKIYLPKKADSEGKNTTNYNEAELFNDNTDVDLEKEERERGKV
jgi:hypothetical protein